MAHMLYCPQHRRVWAYNYGDKTHWIEERICYDCEECDNCGKIDCECCEECNSSNPRFCTCEEDQKK